MTPETDTRWTLKPIKEKSKCQEENDKAYAPAIKADFSVLTKL